MGFPGWRARGRRFSVSFAFGGIALSPAAVFTLKDVARSYSAGDAQFRLTIPHLVIERGSKVAFLGESGSGKSTLLDILAMILRPTSASVFQFKPLEDDSPHDVNGIWESSDPDILSNLRSRYIGYVLQTGGLLPYLTVRENIELSLRLLHREVDNVAVMLGEKLQIRQQLGKLPSELSVGQRQRAAIARALAHNPPILIADEPTAAIDPLNAKRIVALLADLTQELGVTLIVASHAHELMAESGFSPINHHIDVVDEDTMVVSVSNG